MPLSVLFRFMFDEKGGKYKIAMKHSLFFSLIGVGFFMIILVYVPGVKAQVVYNQADTTLLPSVQLDEIEITSMRESGRLKRLPLSAGVLSQQLITSQQIQTLKGASRYVANLFMPDYGSRLTSPVYIRGIGSRINAPSVGLYVDNIPYFEKSVFEFDLLDASRIEVLRGPQGTLYGRNTMGGLINVYSRSPFSYQGTDISLAGGNPGHISGAVSHAGKVSPVLAFSVNAGINRHDGFFRNEYLDQMADEHLSVGGRIRLAWQISSALTAEFTTHYEYLDQGGYPYAVYNATTEQAMGVSYNEPSSYDRKMSSNGLVLNYTTPTLRVQSVSAVQYFIDKQSIDQDFSVADLVFAIQDQSQKMFSQEITARSGHSGDYQWVVGVFGFIQQLDHDLQIDFGPDAVARRMVPALLTRHQASINDTRGAAIFHQSSLHNFLVPDLTLTAGLRLDHEIASLDHNAYMVAAFPTPPPSAFTSELSYFAWMPRLALNYSISDEAGVYAALVRGYKTGGFNVVFEAEEDRSFDPEFSWNYEVGFKGSFLQNRASLQASAFFIDWQNQQIYQMLPSGQGSMLKNAGVSVSKGFEIDMEALITKNLLLRASYGYTHATFIQNSPNPAADYAGNFIPYVPRYTLFGSLGYRLPTNNKMIDAWRFELTYQGVGEHFWSEDNAFSQAAYGLPGVRASMEAGALSVDVFVNNLSSTSYHSFSFSALGNRYVQSGRPATFGMNLRYSL
jgi:iron complex outermembrane recepter protein